MKITDVKTLICHARMRNWIFVKIETDQPGLVGWGEATLEWHTKSVVGAIEDIKPLIVGEDPRRVQHLWQMMMRQHFWHGDGVVRGTAISGIDIALWDIMGKVHNVPCHELWGGRVRDYVRTYCHLGGGNMEEFYETSPDDAKHFADLALRAVDQGYTAFKSMAVPPCSRLEGREVVSHAEACVRAMREAVGDRIDIMVDCHARPSPLMGLQFAKALEPYHLYFFEEPCWPEMMDEMASIQQKVTTPIATGERLVTQHPFRVLCEKRAASVLQPDITHCGGLSEALKISHLADAYQVGLAPHNPQGPVSTAASLELGFAAPSYMICETVTEDVPWRQDVVQFAHKMERDGQKVLPHDKPGLGIEINEEEIAKHPYERELLQRSFAKDGSIIDW